VEGACTQKLGNSYRIEPVYDPMPALLMQDELHLLKESLGTYDSHFEGFLDVAAESLGMRLPSKRIAATATIEGYDKHVRELYNGRTARRFPVQGRAQHNSAYADLDSDRPVGRIYMGILPFGIDSDEVAARIAETVAKEARAYWGGQSSSTQIAGRYDLSLIYVNAKNTAGNLGARLSGELDVLSLTGDRSLDEVRSAIDRIEEDTALPYEERLKVLIATSLISHGVDLNRMNLMAFVGFPGRAADYIQSSSRVGRDNLGLVCTVFEPADNLDRSTYLHFRVYHDRLYQLVQPVPINRFSEASITRTFTGVYASLVLNVLGPLKKESWQGPPQYARNYLTALAQGLLPNEELAEFVGQSYGFDSYGLPTEVDDKLRSLVARLVRQARENIVGGEDFMMHKRLKPQPVSSLREVQQQVEFAVEYNMQSEVESVRGYR
jgi:hypothetical protein